MKVEIQLQKNFPHCRQHHAQPKLYVLSTYYKHLKKAAQHSHLGR